MMRLTHPVTPAAAARASYTTQRSTAAGYGDRSVHLLPPSLLPCPQACHCMPRAAGGRPPKFLDFGGASYVRTASRAAGSELSFRAGACTSRLPPHGFPPIRLVRHTPRGELAACSSFPMPACLSPSPCRLLYSRGKVNNSSAAAVLLQAGCCFSSGCVTCMLLIWFTSSIAR
ncbi:hypothetical protein BS78_04G194000 [Paspalum vaginatum]|nr:hypothetical protein BS78_04G194000 [Paspalum vaginatum]